MPTILRAAFAALLVLTLSMTAKTDETESPKPSVEIIAHRGASDVAPENTLAAFRLARRQGADWFELDCCLCKSGEVVVIHDATVDRTTNGKGAVADLTLSELQQLDAGSWKDTEYAAEKIPTLRQALAEGGPEIGVYVEVKSAGDDAALRSLLKRSAAGLLKRTAEFDAEFIRAVEASESPNLKLARAVISDVKAAKMQQHVVLQSFSTIVCAIAAIEAPELKVELLAGGTTAAAWEDYYRWLLLFDLNGLNTSVKALNEGRLGVLKATGKSCAVYTVDSPAEFERLANLGVERLITNKPDLCLRELKRLGRR